MSGCNVDIDMQIGFMKHQLEITRDYLTARFRAMREGGELPEDVAARVPAGRKRVSDEAIIAAWKAEATVSAVARRVGVSRSAVHQRVERLRKKGVALNAQPHLHVSKEQRQAALREGLKG